MIEIAGLRRDFGGIRALDGVDLRVAVGERHAVIGPNGAGKSTLFNILTGELAATGGTMRMAQTDLGGLTTWQRARLGLARMYQRNELFDLLSARENALLSVASLRGAYRPLRSPGADELAEADRLLDQVGLAGHERVRAGSLSHGERRQLELALALARRPRVLLLDEPTAGMSPAETERITGLIAGLDRALTILIVEHDMDVVFRIADRITVLHEGRPIASGRPDEIRGDTQVHDVYLGKSVGS